MPVDASTVERILDEQPLHRFDRESIEAALGDTVVVATYRLQVLASGGSSTTSEAREDLKAELLSRLDGTYDKPSLPQGKYHWWRYIPSDDLERRLRQLL